LIVCERSKQIDATAAYRRALKRFEKSEWVQSKTKMGHLRRVKITFKNFRPTWTKLMFMSVVNQGKEISRRDIIQVVLSRRSEKSNGFAFGYLIVRFEMINHLLTCM